MKRFSKMITAAFLSAAAALAGSVTAHAEGSVEDVYDAMRRIGLPESMIQEAKNQFQTTQHDEEGMTINETYYPYDVWADMVELYEDDIWNEVGRQFGVSGEEIREEKRRQEAERPAETVSAQPEATAPADPNTPPAVTTQTTAAPSPVTVSVQTQIPFINMTMEEKRDYIGSLPEAERAPFIASLTTAERNSIIKQMDTSSQANIANGFIGLGEQLGMHISVDRIGSGGIDYSVRNSSGTLIDVSSVGTSVDDTGWDTTLPVLGGSGMILAAVGGLTLMTRKSRREEAGEEPLS